MKTIAQVGKVSLVSAVLLGVSACAADGGVSRTGAGAAIGGIAGLIVGNQFDGSGSKYVGALAGALAGGAVGNYLDRQQRDLERQLQAEQAANEVTIQRLSDDSLQLGLNSEVSFDVDSATIKPSFRDTLNKVANVFDDYPNTVIHIVGYTDSSGSNSYNQLLSENRAASVERYLALEGVDERRLIPEGRGESSPIASNATAEGRSRNRRVELILKPIVEGKERDAFDPPV